jgi:hypothetical protein
MRIQTLAAAAVLSLAATIPLSTAAFADSLPDCATVDNSNVQVDGPKCVQDLSRLGTLSDHPEFPGRPELTDHKKPQVRLCDGFVHDIVQDPKPEKLQDEVHNRIKDGKPCRDDDRDHKRRSHDDPEEKSSHHKKSDDSDSDDSDSNSHSSKADDDDGDDDDDTTSTQVKVVPKGSVDTGDGSSL